MGGVERRRGQADRHEPAVTRSRATPAGPGTVYLVGAGPGAMGLVTLRALELVERAEVLAHDRLVPPELVARAPRGCEVIDVGKPAGKAAAGDAGDAPAGADGDAGEGAGEAAGRGAGRGAGEAAGGAGLSQAAINRLLVERALGGATVVRLKGGDPFVFGRGGEEAAACAEAGVPFEVVPGVSAALAAPAWAGIPVTQRGLASSVTIATGHDLDAVDWAALARTSGTLCVLMGVVNLAAIAERLAAGGLDAATPAALVRWGTTPRQQVVTGTIGTIARAAEAAGAGPPAVLVAGQVVTLRERIAWAEALAGRRPLGGVTVLVPRARQQAGALSRLLAERGADPVELPLIEVRPPDSFAALDQAVADLAAGAFAWVGLTSVNGVTALRDRAEAAGYDARLLAGAKVAAVGPSTRAALRAWGITPDLEPESATAAALAAAFPMAEEADARPVLLPRSDLANPELSAVLRRKGWRVVDLVAYHTVPLDHMPAAVRERLDAGVIGWVAFTSASTVEGFLRAYGGPPPPGTRVAAIGPVTAAAAEAAGVRVDTVATEHTIEGLVAALERAHRPRTPAGDHAGPGQGGGPPGGGPSGSDLKE